MNTITIFLQLILLTIQYDTKSDLPKTTMVNIVCRQHMHDEICIINGINGLQYTCRNNSKHTYTLSVYIYIIR